ncbi:hypothetical protein PVAP13_5NG340300 [Panicum virgatum]|uniref:Uncharacterized protein n=1 Tax=Panicum virgatum TaxID=38727 RepID=A0A8T0RVY9_PANVG|nr:hypothetical protein PVAP13_5NG340300 [Panicum virgatum]
MMMGGGHGHLNSDAAAAILFAVLLGNLAISASCTRQQLPGVAGGGTAAEAAAGRRQDDGDGSKIYLIFCQKSKCVNNDREYTCYCCLHWKSACYRTMEACRSICPVCDPKCHPPLPLATHRLRSTTVAPVAGVYVGMSNFVGR